MPTLCYALLRTNYFQNFLVQQIASYLSSELKTEVRVGEVDLTFFLSIVLKDVLVKDLKGSNLIQASKIKLNISDIDFNNNFVKIKKITLEKSFLSIITYKGSSETNLQFIIDYFSPKDTLKEEPPKWNLIVSNIDVRRTNFIYKNENKELVDQIIDFNNLHIKDFNIKIRKLVIMGDTISAKIKSLSFQEQASDFAIEDFTSHFFMDSKLMDFTNVEIKTPVSELNLDFRMKFDSLIDFNDFNNKVEMLADFRESTIDSKDIGCFTTSLNKTSNRIAISGNIKGKIENLKAKNLSLSFGQSSKFLGNIILTGLSEIEETFIHFSPKEFYLTKSDLEKVNYVDKSGKVVFLTIPSQFTNLGVVNIIGSFTGFYNDFVSFATISSDLGEISTDISLKKNRLTNLLEYQGNIDVNNFDLGKMLYIPNDLGKISMKAKINGSGLDKNAKIDILVNIDSIYAREYKYTNIKIDGYYDQLTFKGLADIYDQNFTLKFDGIVDYRNKIPFFDFKAQLKNAQLHNLHLIEKKDLKPIVSADMNFQFHGDKLDSLLGFFYFENISYTEGSKSFFVNKINLDIKNQGNQNRQIILQSDIISADVRGNLVVSDMPETFANFTNSIFPTIDIRVKAKNNATLKPQDFEFDFKFYQTENITKVLLPKLKVAEGTYVTGSYNSDNNILKISAKSNSIIYSGIDFINCYLTGNSENNYFGLISGCERINLSDTVGIDNFGLRFITSNDSIIYNLLWDNELSKLKNTGNINGYVSLAKLPMIESKILDNNILINDSLWTISKTNFVVIDTSYITINNFSFKGADKEININGTISSNPQDKIDLGFRSINISEFDFILNQYQIDLDGILDGNAELRNVYKNPNITSNLKISKFGFNNESLGDLVLNSKWNSENKAAIIDASILYTGTVGTNNPLKVNGNFYPFADNNNFDLNVELTNLKLKVIQPYLSVITSQLEGRASGKLRLEGSVKNPELIGKLKLMHGFIKIDYLNTNYVLGHEIEFGKNYIGFDNFVLTDNNLKKYRGTTAVLNGKIKHSGFKDWSLDLGINADHFTMLNTNASHNELFYGNAIATGNIKISGPVSDILMDINAKTEKGTVLFLPLTYTEEVGETNYITFVSKETKSIMAIPITEELKLSGIRLNFNLEVTPDAEVQMILDEKVGDIIRARGEGDIRLGIDTRGEFTMYGEYIITSGDYLFTLQNVINKPFRFRKGGSIKWTGSPYDAQIDLQAVFRTEAPLYDLLMFIDSSQVYKNNSTIECVLILKGNLMLPDITFDINLPNTDEITKELVRSVLYINANQVNQQEMNRQFVGLLVLHRFFPPESGRTGNTQAEYAGIGTTNSMEMLSRQVSNWLSMISDDFDIGINYRTGEKYTNEELEVALSTQLFNDRIIIDGNFGVGGDRTQPSPTGQNTSNIVGDVNIEYKWTDEGKFRIKAFNKSNANDYINNNSPYTQGVGVFYRKEFNSFKDLWKRPNIKPQKLKTLN